MTLSFVHSRAADHAVAIPAIGLDLSIRIPPDATGGDFCFIETVNAPGKGPPLHRHREAEVFRVIEGCYLYQVDGRRFFAETGDVVCIPGEAEHGFVNVTDAPARQFILIRPAFDALAFFTGLAAVMQHGIPDRHAMNAFGAAWGVEFLGPPLSRSDLPTAP